MPTSVISNLNNSVSDEVISKDKIKLTENNNVHSVQISLNENRKHSILLTDDSNIRDCANKAKDNLNKMYSAVGIVKLGADINTCLPLQRKWSNL